MGRKKKSKKKSFERLFQKIILIAVLVGVCTFALGMLKNRNNEDNGNLTSNDNEQSVVYCYKCGNESLSGENICTTCKEEDSKENIESPNNTEKPNNTQNPDNTQKPNDSNKPSEPNKPTNPDNTVKPENPGTDTNKYQCILCKQYVEQVRDTSDGPACLKCIENVNNGNYTCLNGYAEYCRGCSKCSSNEEE